MSCLFGCFVTDVSMTQHKLQHWNEAKLEMRITRQTETRQRPNESRKILVTQNFPKYNKIHSLTMRPKICNKSQRKAHIVGISISHVLSLLLSVCLSCKMQCHLLHYPRITSNNRQNAHIKQYCTLRCLYAPIRAIVLSVPFISSCSSSSQNRTEQKTKRK